MSEKKSYGKVRKGIVSIESVLSVIKDDRGEEEYATGIRRKEERNTRYLFLEESVKVAGLRLESFKRKGTICVKCNLEASFFCCRKKFP